VDLVGPGARRLKPVAAPGAGSWAVPGGHPLGLATLPYGSFTRAGGAPRLGVAAGDRVLDLTEAARVLLPARAGLFAGGTLDPLLAAGPAVWAEVRDAVRGWLAAGEHQAVVEPLLHPAAEITMLLPFTVADYTDFYASEHHAANLGRILRPGTEPLPAAWKHLPLGYHGRAGTVVVSGTPVPRPAGQLRDPDGGVRAGPSERLDIEAELGFVVGAGSDGPVTVADFDRHVFGVCLVNDWSARDIQAWEYTPLGPFLGKSFATSIGAWVVPLAALDAARVPPPPRDPAPLAWLDDRAAPPWGLDVRFEVRLNGHLIARPPFATMYWTAAQQLAHLTSNGARVRPGDLFASGTVSGPGQDELGSLIELTRNGAAPLTLPDGSTRAFLADDDEVVITATAPGPDGTAIGLGEVRGRVVPGPRP
jgi:fumarylacetoacetase